MSLQELYIERGESYFKSLICDEVKNLQELMLLIGNSNYFLGAVVADQDSPGQCKVIYRFIYR